MNKSQVLRRAVCVVAATGALIGVGAATACAATPGPTRAAHPNTIRAGATRTGTSRIRATGKVSTIKKSSVHIHLYNNSVDKLVLLSTSGDNCGVPLPGDVLNSGTGYEDFEVTFRAFKTTTVTANYDVDDPTGVQIGTAAINLSVNSAWSPSVSSTFTPTAGGSSLPLKTASYGGDFQVEGSDSTPIHTAASTVLAADLVNQYCTTTTTDAKCTYKSVTDSSDEKMALLAESYVDSNSSGPGSVSVASGYSSSTSDSWSVTLSASMELASVFSEGVSATYGKQLTYQNTFTASDSQSVPVGYTGYIWGDVPVTDYTGTMQIQLGGTTYDIDNSVVTEPDSSRSLSSFVSTARQGDDPLHSPSSPQTSARPLTSLSH